MAPNRPNQALSFTIDDPLAPALAAQSFLAWLRNTEASKYRLKGLARQIRWRSPLKAAARDLKPDANDDIRSKINISYAQTPLDYGFRKIHLEIGAYAAKRLARRL